MADEDLEVAHSALRGDVEVIRTYGGQRPHEWVAVWFENEPTVRLVTAFSDNVTSHKAELQRLVAHPDRLEVRLLPWSRLTLERILDQIRELTTTTEMRDAFTSWGIGIGKVNVGLCADREALAGQLQERFGGTIMLTVGMLPYPPGRPLEIHEHRRDALPPPGVRPPFEYVVIEGLDTTLVLSTPQVAPGQEGQGTVVLRNVGSTVIARSSGQPVVGRVVDPASGQFIGGSCRGVAGRGRAIRLDPGDEDTIPMFFGTASMDPSLGYALPPGRYQVHVDLDVRPFPGGGSGHRRQLVSVPPADLTIVHQSRRASQR